MANWFSYQFYLTLLTAVLVIIATPTLNNNNNNNTKQPSKTTQHRRPSFCKVKPKRGPCDGNFKLFYYDHRRGRCKTFTYSGCQGNRNRFTSLNECRAICQPRRTTMDKKFNVPAYCKLTKDTGPCRAAVPRYYFDAESGKCSLFIYGGCQGNRNNFETIEECYNACPIDNFESDSSVSAEKSGNYSSRRPSFCSKKPKTGKCNGHFVHYYFDVKADKCQKFIYGGCEPSKNNFSTRSECMKVCGLIKMKVKNNGKKERRRRHQHHLLTMADGSKKWNKNHTKLN